MASLAAAALPFLLLAELYFQIAVSAESMVGENCNTTIHCKDPNAECFGACRRKIAVNKDIKSSCTAQDRLDGTCNTNKPCIDVNATCCETCICNDAFYKNSNNGCTRRIVPNKPCANITTKNDSCIDDAYCNTINVCVCGVKFITAPTNPPSCIQPPSSSTGSPTVKSTVLPSTSEYTSKVKASHTDSSGPTVQNPVRKSTQDNTSKPQGVKTSYTDSSVSTVQTPVPKTTNDKPNGAKTSKSDSSGSTVKTTVQTSTSGNSAATVAVVEISAYILCFMLAYVNVPN